MTALPEGSVTGSREEARDSLIALWDSLWDATASGNKPEPEEVARMERRFHENIARLAGTGDRLWVNKERTLLARLWDDGKLEVATRDETWETWGPPTYLAEEKVTA